MMSRLKASIVAIAIVASAWALFDLALDYTHEQRWGGPRWGDRTFQQWLVLLDSSDTTQRRLAASAVAKMLSLDPGPRIMNCSGRGPRIYRDVVSIREVPEVLPGLVAKLHDPDPEVRSLIARAVGNCGPDAAFAVAPVSELLRDPQTAAAALFALGTIGPPSVSELPEILAQLHSDSSETRLAAARAYWELRPGPPVVEACCEILDRTQENKREDLLYWMAEAIGPKAAPAVPTVCRIFRNAIKEDERYSGWSSSTMPFACLTLLGAIGPDSREAVPLVLKLFDQNRQGGTQEACLRTLASIGPAASGALPRILGYVRQQPTKSMSPLDFVLPLSAQQRSMAIIAMGSFGAEGIEAVPFLTNVIEERPYDYTVFTPAVVALGRIGPAAKSAVPSLRLLKDKNGAYPPSVALALWRIEKNQAALDSLIESVQRSDPRFAGMHNSLELIAAVSEIGPEAAAAGPALQKFLEATYPPNVLAAEALWNISRESSVVEWLESRVMAREKDSVAAACVLWRIDRRPEAMAFLKNAQFDKNLHGEVVWLLRDFDRRASRPPRADDYSIGFPY